MKVISPKLAGIAILGIAMACCTTTVLAANTVATVNTSTSTAVNPHIYGVNNIWYWMPGANFASYYGTLSAAGGPNATGAGMNYMRFPGGFESESYQWFTDTNSSDVTYGWVANTLDSSYSNYYCPSGTTNPCPPGVTPSTIIADMGNNNVSFVVRTADAMQALRHNNNVTTCKAWAAVAAGLVTTYGSSVKDWQIGNEWYNAYGAPQNLADYEAALAWYGTLVGYYAPLMKQVNPNIRIWETFNIALQSGTINGPTFNLNGYSSDLAAMKAAANAVPLPVGMTGTPWGYVDGLDIHPYAGVNPSPSGNWMPPTIAALAGDIHTLQTDPNGKPLIYGSEWMADLSDNNTTGGLQNADYMLQHFGQLAAAGITQAAYHLCAGR